MVKTLLLRRMVKLQEHVLPANSRKKVELPKGVAESLMSGDLKLPYSDKFSLPPTIPCIGGCGEAHYCSIMEIALFLFYEGRWDDDNKYVDHQINRLIV
ncbi:hypothetical protein TorRG33x02_114840 [Trema orientale]|uniref:Uncharacterized protein n=1 Tax=Trema orientale TaxID=63057 RepID=A0A2P5F4B5_TREOI|nr:hypothetical protein TorRG33x02_114840 [Trema orientale]